MKVEVYENYVTDDQGNATDQGIGDPTYVFEVRKPFAREIWKIQALDVENPEDDAAFDVLEEFVEKVIVKAPKELCNGDGKIDMAIIPPDAFFKIFRMSSRTALVEAKKLSDL